MVVKGTLDSMSYLKPRKWWMKPFAWTKRFQTRTILSQYQDGIRFFNLKVRRTGDGSVHFTNDWMEYDDERMLPLNVLLWLCRASGENNDVYVRLIHDSNDPIDECVFHQFLFELEKQEVVADHFHLLIDYGNEMACTFNDGTIILDMEPERVGIIDYLIAKFCDQITIDDCGYGKIAIGLDFYQFSK